jgi:hypothetical protein
LDETNWPGLVKCDNIIQMMTLNVITITGSHCNWNDDKKGAYYR